jgi:membrane protein
VISAEAAERGGPEDSAVAPLPSSDAPPTQWWRTPVRTASWPGIFRNVWASLCFLMQTEVHVYSFAVAVNVLLSFFPFLVAMIILCQSVLHWRAAVQVIIQAVNDYFPTGFGVDFKGYLMQTATQHKFSWLSVFLLLFTANGIFVPLEVALNRIWRVAVNRSFLRNQLTSLALIFACGALVLISVSITTLNLHYVAQRFGPGYFGTVLQAGIFRSTAVLISMLMIFLVYWTLPNARIPVRRLIPASVVVGGLLEISKYLNILTWPWLRMKLRNEVPPFVQSISIVLWAFVATIIILAGAEWSARVTPDDDSNIPEARLP